MKFITRQMANWASQHDWFRSMTKTDGMYYVISVYDSCDDDVREFMCFDELQAWAGY